MVKLGVTVRLRAFVGVVAVLSLWAASTASAATVSYVTPPNSNFGANEPVNAKATFDINSATHQITVKLLDLQFNPRDAAQLISGVAFTLSTGDPSSTKLHSSTAESFSIDRYGNPTAPTVISPTEWTASNVSLTNKFVGISVASVFLCKICVAGAVNGKDQLLIGGPGSSEKYGNADSTIAGNFYRNPFLLATGDDAASTPTFVLDTPGITSSTIITQVTFTFGTTFSALSSSSQIAGVAAVPEPEPVALALSGLTLIGLASLLRRSKGSL